jgi:hypothetical protein
MSCATMQAAGRVVELQVARQAAGHNVEIQLVAQRSAG